MLTNTENLLKKFLRISKRKDTYIFFLLLFYFIYVIISKKFFFKKLITEDILRSQSFITHPLSNSMAGRILLVWNTVSLAYIHRAYEYIVDT